VKPDTRLDATKQRGEPFHVGWWEHLYTDDDGDQGLVVADAYQYPADPIIMYELEGPDDVTYLRLIESYAKWPKHQSLVSITEGYISPVPVDGTQLRIYHHDGLALHLVVLRQVAWWQGKPGYGEVRWAHGGKDSTFAIRDFSPSTHRLAQLQGAWDAIRIVNKIRPVSGQGKQPGDGAHHHADEAFRQALHEAILHVQHSTGRANPDPKLVMRRVNYGKTQFYDRVKKVTGKRWRDLAAEYEKSGIKRNWTAVQSEGANP
jgi:hypothetical protein